MTQLVNIPPLSQLFTCYPILQYNENDLLITKKEYSEKEEIDLETLAQIWINGFSDDSHCVGSFRFSVLMRCGYHLRPVNPVRNYVKKLTQYFSDPNSCKTLEGAIVYRAMPIQYINILDSNFITTTTSIDIAYRYYKFLNLKFNIQYAIIAIQLPPNIPVLFIGGPDKEVLLPPGTFSINQEQQQILHTFINNPDDLKRIIGIEHIYEGDDYDDILKRAVGIKIENKLYVDHNTSISNTRKYETLPIQFYTYKRQQIGGKKITYTKKYLYEISTILNIKNRSKMDKKQLLKILSTI
jgi:hypothetical protein